MSRAAPGPGGTVDVLARLDAVRERVLSAALAMQRQSWEQGVLGHALLDLGRTRLAAVVAHDAVTRQAPDGRLAEIDGAGHVNGAAAGEVVLRAAPGDERAVAALARQVRWLLEDCPRAEDGTLFHLRGSRQVWADSVYMVVPLLVAVGETEAAAAQVEGHRARLRLPGSGLYAARWDEDAGALVQAPPWATGNAWVVAGLARAARHAGRAGRAGTAAEDLVGHAREVLDACLALRTDDGLLHDVLDDPTTFVDACAPALLAFAAATGAADGWLPPRYRSDARDLLRAVLGRVDDRGLVTGVCGAPRFDAPGTSVEAQASLLLAGAAVGRLGVT